jgi:hypothetical protein
MIVAPVAQISVFLLVSFSPCLCDSAMLDLSFWCNLMFVFLSSRIVLHCPELLSLLKNQQNVTAMLAMPVTVVRSAILHLGFWSFQMVHVSSALLRATQIAVPVYQTELAFVRTLQEPILAVVCSHAHFVIPTTMAILVPRALAKAL